MFIDVYLAFRRFAPSELGGIIDKVKKSIVGPADAANETPTSKDARNFLFEAVVAAKLHCPNRGVEALLGSSSDTGLTYLSRRIFVECKRLGSVGGIENNVRKACNQLAASLHADRSPQPGGLVAVEISSLFDPKDTVTERRLINRSAAAQLDEFIALRSADWQKVYPEKDLRIFGAIFRLSKMVKSQEDGLWVIVTEWGFNPRHHLPWSETRYLKRLARALQSAQNDRSRT